MSFQNNLELFLNGFTWGEAGGQTYTSNAALGTVVQAGLNVASTIENSSTARVVKRGQHRI